MNCEKPGKPIQKELFDTSGRIEEIVFDGDYPKLVGKIIDYVLNTAKETEDFFRIKMYDEVCAYICIWSLYLLGLQLVEQIVNNMEGGDGGEVKGKRIKEYRKIVSVEEEEDLGEKVFVFGIEEKNPPRYFKNSEFLGFEEGYPGYSTPIGKMALRRAVRFVFENLKTNKLRCQSRCFTMVYMLCEGPRFKPLFKYFNEVEDEHPKDFVGWVVNDWECMTRAARRRTQGDTYVEPEIYTLEVVNELKENPAWADDQLAIRHNHQFDRTPWVDQQLLPKLVRCLTRPKDATKRQALDDVSEIIKTSRIPHSYRPVLAQSLLDCAADEKFRGRAMKLLRAIDPELTAVLEVLVYNVCSRSDSYTTSTLVEVLKDNNMNPRVISKMIDCLSDASSNKLDVADRVLKLIPDWSISVTNWNLLIEPIVEKMLAEPSIIILKFLDCIKDQLGRAAAFVLGRILLHTESKTETDESSLNVHDHLCPLSILRLLPTTVFQEIGSSLVYGDLFSKNSKTYFSETWCIATLLHKRAFNEYEAVREIAAELCGRLHPEFLFPAVSSELLKCATERQDLLTIKACLSIVHKSLEVGGWEYVRHKHMTKVRDAIGKILLLQSTAGDEISETKDGCIDCLATMVCTELQGNPHGNDNPLHGRFVGRLVCCENGSLSKEHLLSRLYLARVLISACNQISDSGKTTLGLAILENITPSILDVKEPEITAACIKVLRTIMYRLKSAIVPHSSDLLKVSLDFLERESEMERTGGAELLSTLLEIEEGVVQSISVETRTRLSSLSQTDSSVTVRGLCTKLVAYWTSP